MLFTGSSLSPLGKALFGFYCYAIWSAVSIIKPCLNAIAILADKLSSYFLLRRLYPVLLFSIVPPVFSVRVWPAVGISSLETLRGNLFMGN